jgi:hypothetical protein
MAGFANLRLEQKFFGTEEDIDGHELGSRIGHVEDLTAHRAMTVVKDDDGVFQRAAPWHSASLGRLLVEYSWFH